MNTLSHSLNICSVLNINEISFPRLFHFPEECTAVLCSALFIFIFFFSYKSITGSKVNAALPSRDNIEEIRVGRKESDLFKGYQS
jgi:hypothetical protein